LVNTAINTSPELSMKNFRKELWFNVPTRRASINITSDVQKCIDDSGIQEGWVLVNTRHI
jgi:thiamine phosphate synthase YjbQ (UPF0047 family)